MYTVLQNISMLFDELIKTFVLFGTVIYVFNIARIMAEQHKIYFINFNKHGNYKSFKRTILYLITEVIGEHVLLKIWLQSMQIRLL